MHSYSRLKQWRFCRQAHYFRYVEKIEPIVTPRPLKMGSHIHECVACLAEGEGLEGYIESVQEEYDKMFIEEQEFYGNMPDDLRVIIDGYQRINGEEDENFEFTEIEGELGPVPLTKYTSLTIRPDRLGLDTRINRNFLFESKSGKSLPNEDYRLWDMQCFLYIWGLRELGYQVDGVIWDHVRSKPPTVPRLLKSGKLSTAKNIDTTYNTYLNEIKAQGLDPEDYEEYLDTLHGRENKFYRRVRLPIKESMLDPVVQEAKITSLEIHLMGEMPPVKNVSRTTCQMCSYKAICEAELLGLDVDYVKDRQFRLRPGREDPDEEESIKDDQE